MKDLVTKGYIVIPDFLTAADIEYLLADYEHSKQVNQPEDRLYTIYPYSIEAYNYLHEKMSGIIKQVAQETDINADVIIKPSGLAGYFCVDDVNYGWHQDVEPYLKWGAAYNTLNFWIPLIKPKEDKDGIDVVPFDKLPDQTPFFDMGGSSLLIRDNTTIVYNLETNVTTKLDFNIDDYKTSISCKPGDLVLMRGDILHQTQEVEDYRVALSIRTANGNIQISRDRFFGGSDRKQKRINTDKHFEHYVKTFKSSEKEVMTLYELEG